MFKSTSPHIFDRFRQLEIYIRWVWTTRNWDIYRIKILFFDEIPTHWKRLFEWLKIARKNNLSPSPRPIGKWQTEQSVWNSDAHRKLKSTRRKAYRTATWVSHEILLLFLNFSIIQLENKTYFENSNDYSEEKEQKRKCFKSKNNIYTTW